MGLFNRKNQESRNISQKELIRQVKYAKRRINDVIVAYEDFLATPEHKTLYTEGWLSAFNIIRKTTQLELVMAYAGSTYTCDHVNGVAEFTAGHVLGEKYNYQYVLERTLEFIKAQPVKGDDTDFRLGQKDAVKSLLDSLEIELQEDIYVNGKPHSVALSQNKG